MKTITRFKPYWTKLDNAAVIFPAVTSRRNSSFFRLSVTLSAAIDPQKLQAALDICINRFPFYHVRLKQGAFWMFLEENSRRPLVEEDRYYPCLTLKTPKQRDLLFRILYLNDRISLELSHILTDGFGASVFLKNITAEYLRQCGHDIPVSKTHDVLDLNAEPLQTETIDAYHKIYDAKAPKDKSLPKAYQMHLKKAPLGVDHIITGVIIAEELLKITRNRQITITEYIISVILFVLQDIQKNDKKNHKKQPLRINVPANLRRFYDIPTLRNFSLYTTPGIDPKLGEFTFEEIIDQVHHYMQKNNTEKYIRQQITRNVGGEINPFVRSIPLPIKIPFLRSMHTKFGETQQTICLSNLGNFSVPDSMIDQIERFDFIPAGSELTSTMLAMTGFKGKVFMTFGRVSEEPLLERRFFKFLHGQGIDVTLESNNTTESKDLLKRRWEEL